MPSSSSSSAVAKKRGSYNCGRCGLPKKGHVCHASAADPDSSTLEPPKLQQQQQPSKLRRRALSFDEAVEVPRVVEEEETEEEEEEGEGGVLPRWCLMDVMRRLPPKGLMVAAGVCKGWRDCVRRVWRSTEELRLLVPPKAQIGFVGSVLQKCEGLVRLSLRMESDFDATMLACIAFSCTNLEKLEISTADSAINRITGNDLNRFVVEKRCLSTLNIEGCTNLGFLSLSSSSLSTLWLSDLYCISKTVINCSNLKELSFDFSRQENDSTDLATMVESLGRTCPRLRNVHIASTQLCNAAVLALAGANLRGLRLLSLLLGSKINDASVAAIVQCYTDLELLDLSGSSVSDSGIGMICNVLPNTLSRLLLALCPNITSSGIQFATAQLPFLRVIDCGMSMCDVSPQIESLEEGGLKNKGGNGEHEICQESLPLRLQSMYQKLIIKHGRLKKLSLWGCSSLNALYLNCPELKDLNLNSCTNLNPERLLLQCPTLEKVHATGCQDMLLGAIQNQIQNEFSGGENNLPRKRLADGSKRVQVPDFVEQQPSEDKNWKRPRHVQCTLQC